MKGGEGNMNGPNKNKEEKEQDQKQENDPTYEAAAEAMKDTSDEILTRIGGGNSDD